MTDTPAEPLERIFLVVVDNTAELRVALRFASLRARNTGGRVALLYVIEPADFQHWMSVENLMREEGRLEAEEVLQSRGTSSSPSLESNLEPLGLGGRFVGR